MSDSRVRIPGAFANPCRTLPSNPIEGPSTVPSSEDVTVQIKREIDERIEVLRRELYEAVDLVYGGRE